MEPDRIWGEKCTKSDIVINQGSTAPLPSGIPTYTVEIMNMCVSGCDISAIHLRCGWFSSARLINPKLFKRLRYNDCLVNDGRPLVNGGTVSFQYANTYLYPLSVSSVVCVWTRVFGDSTISHSFGFVYTHIIGGVLILLITFMWWHKRNIMLTIFFLIHRKHVGTHEKRI